MMTFYKAPHRAMLSYVAVRSSAERRNMRQELEKESWMLHMCIGGAAVTLAGGMILGACMVAMMR